MRATPERFVRLGHASRDPDDRLKGDRDVALAQQLLHLASKGHRARALGAAAERDRGSGTGSLRRLVSGRGSRHAYAELNAAEVYDVALVDLAVLDGLAVHERAVRALEVADAQLPPVLVDLRVHLRHGLRRQHQLEPGPAPDAKGKGMEGHDAGDAVLGDRLEMPGRTCP